MSCELKGQREQDGLSEVPEVQEDASPCSTEKGARDKYTTAAKGPALFRPRAETPLIDSVRCTAGHSGQVCRVSWQNKCDGPLQQQAGLSGCDDPASAATSDPEVQSPPPVPIHIRVMRNRVRTFMPCTCWIKSRFGRKPDGRVASGKLETRVEKEEDQEDGAASWTEDPTGNPPGSVDLQTSGAGGAQRSLRPRLRKRVASAGRSYPAASSVGHLASSLAWAIQEVGSISAPRSRPQPSSQFLSLCATAGLFTPQAGPHPCLLFQPPMAQAMAPRGPQPAGPIVVRAGLRVARLLPWARQPAPLPLRGRAASTVFNAPTGASAARPQAGPSTTQGRAGSKADS
ncbi:hypothetical protein NDU88_001687 [Pleurodeles waltl]|uniref:Uncharacterized protein n=1 Tax=Pleurodeles waltl TaxID=8319 RepID=A0AAV7LZB4_PLEWA|nr:hypothetical protein NDU88_001687 [Pleurodeles waltl]